MEKIKLVIVDDDAELCEVVTAYINAKCGTFLEVIGVSHDGASGLALIKKVKPDVAMIDLVLPKMDGLSLLSELRKAPETAKLLCILMSALGNNCVLTEAMDFGCDYFYIKPFNLHTVSDRILSLYQQKQNRRQLYNFDQFDETTSTGYEIKNSDTSELLLNLGIKHMNQAFYYLKYAIEQCINEKRLLDCVTKELYPSVAKEYNISTDRVERSIRHLLQINWSKGAGKVFTKTTGLPTEFIDKKPTTSMFIRFVVDYHNKTKRV